METIVESTGPAAVSGPPSARPVDDRVRAGFIAAYTREHPRVVAFVLRRTGQRPVAEDVAAEVFRIAWERVDEVGLPSTGWLFVTARHLMLAHHRATRRSEAVRQRLATEAVTRQAGSEDQRNYLVLAALDALPDAQRDLLTAYYWDDPSGAECAALAGCSLAAVWVRLHRARAALRAQLAKPKGE